MSQGTSGGDQGASETTAKRKRNFYRSVAVFVGVMALLVVIDLSDGGISWVLGVAALWGAALAIQGAWAFGLVNR